MCIVIIDALVCVENALLKKKKKKKKQKNQCALPGERARNSSAAGTPLVSGGEALFLLLLLLTVSMCVSVLLSPESRRRRRERREREAREKARALRREQKRWDRSVTKGLWLEQPDGAVCVCVFDADATTKDDGDTSRSRRGRRAAAMKRLNQSDASSPETRVPGVTRLETRASFGTAQTAGRPRSRAAARATRARATRRGGAAFPSKRRLGGADSATRTTSRRTHPEPRSAGERV
jgi:hypothetical protein